MDIDRLFAFNDSLQAALLKHGIKLTSVGYVFLDEVTADWAQSDPEHPDATGMAAHIRLPDGRETYVGFQIGLNCAPGWTTADRDKLVELAIAELEKDKIRP